MSKPLSKSCVNTHDPKNPIRDDITMYKLFENAKKDGFLGELVNMETGQRVTTLDVLNKAEEYAKGFLALGMVPGEDNLVVVGCCSMEAVCLYAACLAVGMGYAHPDIHEPRENSIIIQTSLVKPKIMVCGEGTQGLTFDALEALFEEGSEQPTSSKLPFVKHVFYDQTYKSREPALKYLKTLDQLREIGKTITDEQLNKAKQLVKPEHVAIHFFTSGSTGIPKCVSHGQTGLPNDLRNLTFRLGTMITSNVNVDSMTCFGLLTYAFCGYCTKVVMIPETNAKNPMTNLGEVLAQGIIDEKVEFLCLSPGPLKVLINYLDNSSMKLPRMKTVFCSGMLVTNQFRADCVKHFGGLLVTAYGMTETFGIASAKPTATVDGNDTEQGPVLYMKPNAEARIVNDDNEVVDIGEVGEIQIKVHSALKEYRGDPQKTKELFTKDGYLKTGDMGIMNADGGFVVKGRMVDRIRFKINNKVEYPSAIEQIVTRHPDIADASVFAGGYFEWLGDEIICCVIMKEGATHLSEEEFFRTCRLNGMSNDRQRPARIIYLDNFSYTGNERKVSKKVLLERVTEMIKSNKDLGKCQWFKDMEKSVSTKSNQ